MDMEKPKNHKHRPMNSRKAENDQAGARQGAAATASHSITLRCCPPSLAPTPPSKNLSEGANLSKGLTWKTGPLDLKPWICTGRAAHPKHKTRHGLVIQVTADNFTTCSKRRMHSCSMLQGVWFCRRAKRRTLYSGGS